MLSDPRLIGGLVLAGLSALAAGPAPAPARLTVSPFPGTPDASPSTQISILGVAPQRIRSVLVAGEASGVHPGRLARYSGGRGPSFQLRSPLTHGERVSVAIRIAGRRTLGFAFTVAARRAPAAPQPLGHAAGQARPLRHPRPPACSPGGRAGSRHPPTVSGRA